MVRRNHYVASCGVLLIVMSVLVVHWLTLLQRQLALLVSLLCSSVGGSEVSKREIAI